VLSIVADDAERQPALLPLCLWDTSRSTCNTCAHHGG